MEKIKLNSFGSLFKESFNDFKTRFKTISVLALITLAVSIVFTPLIIVGFMAGIANVALGATISALAMIIFAFGKCFMNGVFMYSMKDGAKVKESFKFIWKNLKSYLWIIILIALVVLPGFIAGIIPGIIISVFLMFSSLIFMDDGTKGMSALIKSKNYIKGFFWPIVGRLTLFSLVVMGGTIVITILGQPILQFLLEFFVIMPVSFCFLWRLYKDLKNKKPEIASTIPGKKGWIKVLAIVGGVLITVVVITISVVAVAISPKIKQGLQEFFALHLTTYQNDNINVNDEGLQKLLENIQGTQK
ncbi:MAG: hypothetical protein WC519_01285 [Parcubacteria group bacterium]